ncbi:MAG: hypothetical protein U0835_24240 [Isosphaeraceae bacterium]
MTWLKIGQRMINLDLATCIEDLPAARAPAKGRAKAGGNGHGEGGGGIRVVFGKESSLDFTGGEAEQLLSFVEARSFQPLPLPVEADEEDD